LSAQIFNPWDTRPCLDSTRKEKHRQIEGEKEKEEDHEDRKKHADRDNNQRKVNFKEEKERESFQYL
jgi:hypothetical protein